VRPILVGDAWRRLVLSCLLEDETEALARYFLHSHPRVQQFGVGVPDGAILAYQLMMSCLPNPTPSGSEPMDLGTPAPSPPPSPAPPSDARADSPVPSVTPGDPYLGAPPPEASPAGVSSVGAGLRGGGPWGSEPEWTPLPQNFDSDGETIPDDEGDLVMASRLHARTDSPTHSPAPDDHDPLPPPPPLPPFLSSSPPSLMDSSPSPRTAEARDGGSPVVLVSIDAENAFNAIARQAVYDGIAGVASVPYNRGAVGVGEAFAPPNPLYKHLRTVDAYYGSTARLQHLPRCAVSPVVIEGTAGVQQGDVLGPSLFASGLHPTLVRVAEEHEDVMVVAYADNAHLVGPLDKVLPAVSQLIAGIQDDLSLRVNLSSSWVFCWDWLGRGVTGLPGDFVKRFPALAALPVVQEGVKILGVPVGTPDYVSRTLESVATDIVGVLPRLAPLPDGKVHFQAVKYCVLPKFHYLLRALPPAVTVPVAERIDEAAVAEVAVYGGWDRRAVERGAGYLEPHRLILQVPHSKGGLSLTPLAGKALPAFYAATGFFLRWMAGCPVKMWGRLAFSLPHHAQSDHPLTNAFRASHYRLLHLGAIEDEVPPPAASAPPPSSSAPPPPLRVPSLRALVERGSVVGVPRQAPVTRFAMRMWGPHQRAGASFQPRVRALLRAQGAQEVQRWAETSIFKADFTKPSAGKPSTPLRSSPLSFLSSLQGTGAAAEFPREVWRDFFCGATGMPLPGASAAQVDGVVCHCGKTPDVFGDHFSTCSQHQKGLGFRQGHEEVVEQVAALGKLAGVLCKTDQASMPLGPTPVGLSRGLLHPRVSAWQHLPCFGCDYRSPLCGECCGQGQVGGVPA